MISRIGDIGPSPSPRDAAKQRLVATGFEKEITAYVAVFLNLNPRNLEAQLPNIAHRTIELIQKAREAQTC